MKRIVVALAVAALFNTAQALAETSPFPSEAPEFIGLSPNATYAGRSGDKMAVASVFPSEAPEFIGLAGMSNYAERSGDKVAVANTFPGEAPEFIGLASQWTYADNQANQRTMHARGASDPALAE